jgi:hypothetical protein
MNHDGTPQVDDDEPTNPDAARRMARKRDEAEPHQRALARRRQRRRERLAAERGPHAAGAEGGGG